MTNTPTPPVAALYAERQAVKQRIAEATARLAAARDAAARPAPTFETITDLEIERARLQDLADAGARQAELIARRAAAAKALQDHANDIAAAKREAVLAEAAVQHETMSMEELRRLELVAISIAATPMIEAAEAAYRRAAKAMIDALADLRATVAAAGADQVARLRQGTTNEGLSPFEFGGVGAQLPGNSALVDHECSEPHAGQFRPTTVEVSRDFINAQASQRLAVMLSDLRGQAK